MCGTAASGSPATGRLGLAGARLELAVPPRPRRHPLLELAGARPRARGSASSSRFRLELGLPHPIFRPYAHGQDIGPGLGSSGAFRSGDSGQNASRGERMAAIRVESESESGWTRHSAPRVWPSALWMFVWPETEGRACWMRQLEGEARVSEAATGRRRQPERVADPTKRRCTGSRPSRCSIHAWQPPS